MERRVAREALLDAERRATAGLLASSVAHDINNALGIITGNLGSLRRIEGLAPDDRQAVIDIEEAAGRLGNLVQRLRDAGGRPGRSQARDLDLAAVVTEVVGLTRLHRRVRHCRVRVEADKPVGVRADPGLFEPVLLNLVLNAADATNGRGTIEVRVRAEGESALLEVHDDGPGIPEDFRARVFEPFHTTKAEGSGLGLFSVKSMIEAAGGTVDVDNSPLGGVCLRVALSRVDLPEPVLAN